MSRKQRSAPELGIWAGHAIRTVVKRSRQLELLAQIRSGCGSLPPSLLCSSLSKPLSSRLARHRLGHDSRLKMSISHRVLESQPRDRPRCLRRNHIRVITTSGTDSTVEDPLLVPLVHTGTSQPRPRKAASVPI